MACKKVTTCSFLFGYHRHAVSAVSPLCTDVARTTRLTKRTQHRFLFVAISSRVGSIDKTYGHSQHTQARRLSTDGMGVVKRITI